MIIELIRKEIKQRNGMNGLSRGGALASVLGKFLLYAAFIAIECYVFLSLDKKIESYSSYGTYDFLVLFLFVLLVGVTLLSTVRARSVLYDSEDTRVSTPLPIPSGSIIISKLVYVYIQESIACLVVSFPLLACYGAVRGYMPYFYILSFLYPFIVSLFSVGISLVLAIPYQVIYRYIQGKDLLQFIVASILMIALCFLYQFVLNLFLNALSDSSIGGMFDQGFINSLHNMSGVLVPVSSYFRMLVYQDSVVSGICLMLGLIIVSLAVGLSLSSASYLRFNREERTSSKEHKEVVKKANSKPKTQFRMLLEKEWRLLFSGTAYLFSYTSVLVMVPFLSFVVVSSLTSIVYSNLDIFTIYFPGLVDGIDMALILLFNGITVSSVSLSVSREGKNLQTIKTIPVDPFRQLAAKTIIPFVLSGASLVVTTIVLLVSSYITVATFFVSLLLGISQMAFSLIIGLELDMRSRKDQGKNMSFLIGAFSLVFPLLVLLIHVSMTLGGCPGYSIYLVEIAIALALVPAYLVKIKGRLRNSFYAMEVNA